MVENEYFNKNRFGNIFIQISLNEILYINNYYTSILYINKASLRKNVNEKLSKASQAIIIIV